MLPNKDQNTTKEAFPFDGIMLERTTVLNQTIFSGANKNWLKIDDILPSVFIFVWTIGLILLDTFCRKITSRQGFSGSGIIEDFTPNLKEPELKKQYYNITVE